MIDKIRLAQQFGKAAGYYHQHAKVQQYAADRLLSWLAQDSILPGKVLEVGCGTGFLSQGLVDLFPDHDLEISDLSSEILSFCQDHLSLAQHQLGRIRFKVLDGENLVPPHTQDDRYSLIISSFVLQWFQAPEETICNLYHCLKPGGALRLVFPSDHSFPELKQHCSDRQVPYPFNPLPNFKTIVEMLYEKGLCCEYRTEWYSETYGNFGDVFEHLKKLGAGLKTEGKPLSYSQMRTILKPTKNSKNAEDAEDTENTEITVSYHIVFLFIYRVD